MTNHDKYSTNRRLDGSPPKEDSPQANSGIDLSAAVKRFFNLPIEQFLPDEYAGIFITDENDILIWVNRVIHEHASMGHEVGMTIGKPAIHVLYYLQGFVAQPYFFVEMTKDLLRKKKNFLGYEFLLKDGRTMNLDFYTLHEGTEYKGAIWQLTDFTHRLEQYHKLKKDSSNSFLKELEKFQLAYCEVDANGFIRFSSPSFRTMTGYPEIQLAGRSIFDFCVSGKQNLRHWIRKELVSTGKKAPAPIELEIIQRNQTTRWTACHVSFVVNHKEHDTIIKLLFTDITEQKNLHRDLEFAKQKAERAQKAQQQFLASMSHDIRTPLNAIVGMIFLLQATPLNEEQQEYIKALKNSSDILLGMSNGVLDFAKIESGKLEVHQREVDLPKLIQSLVETLNYKIANKPLRLFYRIDDRINQVLLGDDILLNQILMNLLGNAEKFTAKGEIELNVAVVKAFDTTLWVEFSVRDTGIGISKERQKEIFQDFTQADADIGVMYGGSGLGLFICKKLVEVLGGHIAVDSVPGKGTTFIFSVPLTLTNQPLKRENDMAMLDYSFRGRGLRLLVVEDNPMNLKYLSSLLGKYELDFDTATNGKSALDKATKSHYHLILMDMKLPGMNGLEVAANIRERETANVATPIVLVSAAAFQSTIDKAKECGVNELLTKPYTPDQLLAILLKYLVEDEEEEGFQPITASQSEEQASVFKFDEQLDTAYLQKLYSGNFSYAMSLFEVFIECMEKDWQEIQRAIKDKDFTTLKNLAHKVKPNFSMVGLTWVTNMMQDAYNELKQEDHEKALAKIDEIREEMDRFMPLIKKELSRMENFAGQGIA